MRHGGTRETTVFTSSGKVKALIEEQGSGWSWHCPDLDVRGSGCASYHEARRAARTTLRRILEREVHSWRSERRELV